jgi:3-phenylpropionate/trans-cinnamate dioxygenase ferredoxin subunit
MGEFVPVADLDTLVEAKPKVVEAGGRELVLILWRGDVYALRNICAHMSTTLALGTVMGLRTGVVGEPAIDATTPIISCPWHQYEYALGDGQCLTDAGLRVRSYPVAIEDGKVTVDLSGHRGGRRAKHAGASEPAAAAVS